jgi:hypothetical protein
LSPSLKDKNFVAVFNRAKGVKKTNVPTINAVHRNNKMDAHVELAPLNELDAILQHAASHVNKLSLKLPVQYRF